MKDTTAGNKEHLLCEARLGKHCSTDYRFSKSLHSALTQNLISIQTSWIAELILRVHSLFESMVQDPVDY